MSSKNTSKQSIRFRYLFLAVFALSFSLFQGVGGQYLLKKVAAAGTSFAFYYNSDDPAAVKNLKQELKKRETYNGPNISATKILVKNGPGSKDNVLHYDLATTNAYNVKNNGDDNDNEYFFSKRIYCTIDDKKITDVKPTGTKPYVNMIYTVGIKLNEDKLDDATFDGDNARGGVSAASIVTPSTSGGAANVESIYDKDGNRGVEGVDDHTDEINPEQCRPGGRGEISVANYGKLSSDAKKGWKNLADEAVATAGERATDQGAEGGQADCDAKGGFSLSWIICPIIDAGANASDYVFNNLITPLLANVPITSEKSDPGYQAWQNFRLIGNILLVATLLAVVYSQARGGK